MSKRGDKEFLLEMKEAMQRVTDYTARLDYEEFLKDKKTQDAVLRNIEILGEAAKNLSKGLKDKHKDIEWKNIAGMRDKIDHFYFGIKWELVWSVINDKIPGLLKEIKAIIRQTKKVN